MVFQQNEISYVDILIQIGIEVLRKVPYLYMFKSDKIPNF